MNILLTGGAGYIGSHTAVSLLNSGYQIVIADNLINSNLNVIKRIEAVTGCNVPFYHTDIIEKKNLASIFSKHHFDCIVHLAGLKSIRESIEKPLLYYNNNIVMLLNILECMQLYNVSNIIFSSSATVYGQNNPIPYEETMSRGSVGNTYGWTKVFAEQILEDMAKANPHLSVVLLRYFNPIGAHPSGNIGEDPQGTPYNLMPYLTQVLTGQRDHLTIFGNDYPTHDGTCRRDYLHVMDLAEGHAKAVEYAVTHKGAEAFNLGTGTPYSVLELVHTMETVSGKKLKYVFGPRREGDLPEFWANVQKAHTLLNWHAVYSLKDMCRDAWNWQQQNPLGYNTPY